MYVHCISWALKMLTGNFLCNIFVQFATLIDVLGKNMAYLHYYSGKCREKVSWSYGEVSVHKCCLLIFMILCIIYSASCNKSIAALLFNVYHVLIRKRVSNTVFDIRIFVYAVL